MDTEAIVVGMEDVLWIEFEFSSVPSSYTTMHVSGPVTNPDGTPALVTWTGTRETYDEITDMDPVTTFTGDNDSYFALGLNNAEFFDDPRFYVKLMPTSWSDGGSHSTPIDFNLTGYFYGETAGSSERVVGVAVTPPSPAVPEPTTMLLLGAGLVGLAGLRRRFRKR